MKTCPRLVLLTLLLTSSTVALAQTEPATPAVIKLGSGFNYSRGDYGFSQDTELWSVPLNLSYDIPRWALKSSFSYLTVKGPANVATGTTPSPGPARPTSAKQSGLGDTSLSATYHANPVPGELNVDFTARVKLPTGDDDKGLGTGETDYYLQTDVNQTFGKVTLIATAGYRFMGSNEVTRLKDGLYAMAGAAYRLTDKTVAGAAYDWHSKIIEGSDNAHNLLAFVATNPNDRWNLLAYGLMGFNDASPEIALGGLATFKF
jgi:hypothetical protein